MPDFSSFKDAPIFWQLLLLVVVIIQPYIYHKIKNVAQKEDIANITEEIEKVRVRFDKMREDNTTENKLRLSIFDQRFRAHQEAFSLWLELFLSINNNDWGKNTNKCQEWFKVNCLYLDKEARDAFAASYSLVGSYRSYLGAGKGQQERAEKLLHTIENAGTIIQKSVGLPPIAMERFREPDGGG